LTLIRELYTINSRAKIKPPDERHLHRQQQQQMAPHLELMRDWLDDSAAFG